LLECAVERGAQRLDLLVEVNRRDSALGDALGCEFEFLCHLVSISLSAFQLSGGICIPHTPSYKVH
jgi:hypothetical protein